FEGQIETAETQKAFITRLAELPTRPPATPAAGEGQPREDWQQILSLIGSSMTDVQRTIQEARVRIRDIDRRIEELEKELESQAPAVEERTEVKVHLSAPSPVEADLVVRYQVPSASWTPLYDARLATGSKSAAPTLALTRRAVIRQRTGEPWQNVALTLSTTRPSSNVAAPELEPIAVDFEPERPIVAQSPAPEMERAAPRGRMASKLQGAAPPAPPAAMDRAA